VLIREATESDAAGVAKVQVDSWRTTYKGIVPDSYIASLSYENRVPRWEEFLAALEEQFAFVAETDEKEIIGFVSGGKNRDDDATYQGELYAIYLLESYQRRGTGRLLVEALAERLLRKNLFSMIVWVLAENPSRAFYESLGGKYVTEKVLSIGGAPLLEVAYGWDELNSLLKK
jgi:ribosomal protein S18 acetylase RimI-like enzyme